MRDHVRILGSLFVAWGVVQGVAALVLGFGAGPGAGGPAALWLLALAVAGAYVWTGLQLRRGDPRIRIPAAVMSGVAILSFPVGTALGIYGFWVLFGRRSAPEAR